MSEKLSDQSDLWGNETSAVYFFKQAMGHYPLLSEEDTIRLLKTYQQGTRDDASPEELQASNDAINFVVACNWRLALKYAYMHLHARVPLADLIQQANLAIMSAFIHWDPDQGSLANYAFGKTRRYIQLEKARQDEFPDRMSTWQNKIKQQEEQLKRHLSNEEIQELLGISEFELTGFLAVSELKAKSFSDVDSPENQSIVERLEDPSVNLEEQSEVSFLRQCIDNCLANGDLTPMQVFIIKSRYNLVPLRVTVFDPSDAPSYRELGKLLRKSPETIRKMENQALRVLATQPELKAWIANLK